MAVQFVIGRAGTGKTQYCVDALSAASTADPLGPPLFWIMPEQATFMSEQRLIAAPDFSGSFRIHVVGFRQLCRFLATELKLTPGREISPIGRQLLLARTVHACRDRLTAYQKVASLPGFLASLDRTLRELIQARQSSEQLRVAARKLQAELPQNLGHIGGSLLADKLHDLALLLETWDHVRPANDFDAEMLPTIIENAMARVERLKGTSVYVDAFSSMSVMETELLSLLAKKADTVVITLLADPASPVFSDPLAAPAALGVFHRTEQLYQRLMRQFQISGVMVENPIFLHTPHRLRRCPALAHLESQLFNGDFNPSTPITSDQAIELLACPSPEEEVLDAGRRIQAMVAGGMRYRDIGVVVTDLAAYAPLIDTTFAALKIPFFLDQRQSLKFHPLVDFLRSLTTLIRRDFSRADILSLVKTSLTGMNRAQLYTLENYFLAHGIQRDTLDSNWQWKQLPADEENDQPSADDIKNLKEINATRRQLRRALEPWITLNLKAQNPQPIAAFAVSVITVLDSMHVGTIMEQWIQQALSDGSPELAQIHQQAWSECLDMLREMAALSENHAHSAAEFSQLLQTLLDNLTLGLIPPAVDQVLISSAQRSRHPELKAVLIIGALETMMPRVAAEDGMINNADRRQLKPILGDALNLDTAEDFMEAAFFDYVAFTRAAEKLIISYPAADADGRKTSPSIYMNRIGALFRDVSTTFMESADIRWPDFAALDELIRWVLLEAADNSPGFSRRPDSARIALAQQWLADHGDPAVRRRWQQALAAQNRAAIPPLPEDLGRLSLGPAVFSVSELETYAACPLRHFYQYTLHLRQRPQWQIDARNLGMIYHKALEVFYRAVIDGSLPWPDCEEKQFTKILSEAIAESTRALAADAIADALELQAIVKPMQRHLGIILEAQRRAAQGNHLRAIATELRFGNFSDNYGASPMLSAIELGDAGQSLLLRGKIDRLDVAPMGKAMLVDYKSGAKTFHFGYFLQGLDLQLVAYMLAVRGRTINGKGPLKPIAAFYYPLRPPEVSAPTGKDQRTLTPADSQYYKKCKPDGPFDNSAIDILDSSVEAGQSSAWFKIALTKEGKPHAIANGGLEHELFAATLNEGLQIMRRIAREIKEGHIAPLPFRAGTTTPCDTCDFKSICPFDRQRGIYRSIETDAKTARSEFQEKLTFQGVEQQ
jgi:ATP-dependent helicase/nuclease subunit B